MQIPIRGPGSSNYKKLFSALKLKKGGVCFEGDAQATKKLVQGTSSLYSPCTLYAPCRIKVKKGGVCFEGDALANKKLVPGTPSRYSPCTLYATCRYTVKVDFFQLEYSISVVACCLFWLLF
jgi:hypothetical protein